MTKRSRYDELHDRHHTILTTKAGTRYEMLAAMVFKTLEERNVVIHDLKLVGDSSVSHQIDVAIEVNGQRRRIVLECKDFDISNEKVGLDIIRNFRSVIEDTQADEGIVLTCTAYTKDAQKYAKAKNIKLVVLREIEDADMEGRIETIVMNLHIQIPKNHQASVSMSEKNQKAFEAELERVGIQGGFHQRSPVFFVRGKERIQFNTFLSEKVNGARATKTAVGLHEAKTMPDGWSLQVESGPLIPFDFILTTYELETETHEMKITSDRIVEMILTGFDDNDILIFGDQLKRRKINPDTGEIL